MYSFLYYYRTPVYEQEFLPTFQSDQMKILDINNYGRKVLSNYRNDMLEFWAYIEDQIRDTSEIQVVQPTLPLLLENNNFIFIAQKRYLSWSIFIEFIVFIYQHLLHVAGKIRFTQQNCYAQKLRYLSRSTTFLAYLCAAISLYFVRVLIRAIQRTLLDISPEIKHFLSQIFFVFQSLVGNIHILQSIILKWWHVCIVFRE